MPRDLETICLKCLQKEPAQRYASAGELADDLGRFLDGEPIVARSIGLFERRLESHPRPTAAALLAVILTGILFLIVAVPLHFRHLHSQVRERTAEAIEERTRSRRAKLQAACERKLAEGRIALPRNLSEAFQLFTAVKESIHDEDAHDPQLSGLRDEANRLLQQTIHELDRQLGSAPARAKSRKFLALRDEAFFRLTTICSAGRTPTPASPGLPGRLPQGPCAGFPRSGLSSSRRRSNTPQRPTGSAVVDGRGYRPSGWRCQPGPSRVWHWSTRPPTRKA